MPPFRVRSLAAVIALSACMSLAACAPTPSFEDDVAAARAAQKPTRPTSTPPAPAANDPWNGYYEDHMRQQTNPAAFAFGGSFGPPGAVTVAENVDFSLPAGRHIVQVQCDGPPSAAVTLAAVEADDNGTAREIEPVETTLIDCSAITLLELTTTRPGIAVRIDSRDEPGGFVVRVDPSEVTVDE